MFGRLAILGGLAAQAADPRCAPVSELEFRAELLDLRSALELDQAATHDALVTRVVDAVPCLDFAVPARMWSELLVHVALREFAAGGDWEAPLAAALRAHDAVDRGVGPGHPVFEWTPPEAAEARGERVPPGRLWWVDGESSLTLPPPSGVHLVQVTDGRWWGSAVTWNAAVPDAWLRAPITPPRHLAAWADAGVVAGASVLGQRPRPAGADWFEGGLRPSPLGAVTLAGRAALWSAFGPAAELRVPAARDSWPEARALLAASDRRVWAGLGAGVISAGVRQGEGRVQRLGLAYPAAGAGARLSAGRRDLEVRASGGLRERVQAVTAELASVPSGPEPGWRVSLRADGAVGHFVQKGTAVRVDTALWSLGVGVALAVRSDP